MSDTRTENGENMYTRKAHSKKLIKSTRSNCDTVSQIARHYETWMNACAENGDELYLITCQFMPLVGSIKDIKRIMNVAIEQFYGKLLTRLMHHPKSPSQYSRAPKGFFFPDWPVPKRQKKPVWEVNQNCCRPNGGLHMHGILAVAPHTRLKCGLDTHIMERQSLYCVGVLSSVDARLVWTTADKAVAYALKSLPRVRADLDDILIVPRSKSELH